MTAAMGTALTNDVSRPLLLGKFEFVDTNDDPAPVFMWTGRGSLLWNGDTYIGVGDFLKIDLPAETSDASSTGASFTLSNSDPAWASLALNTNYQGKVATLWYGEWDNTFTNIISDPIQIFKGKMDLLVMEDSANGSTITLTVERMNYDDRPNNERWDTVSQQRRFPDDRGFEFIPSLQDVAIPWGVADATSSLIARTPPPRMDQLPPDFNNPAYGYGGLLG
jgi:hypothetical protein